MRIKDPPLIITAVLVAIPLAVLVIFVYQYSVNIPFLDQWDITYLFDKFDKSELAVADFWRQHNEHRLVFPKLIFLALGIISSFDVRWEMIANIVIAVLLYLLVIRHIDKNKDELLLTDNHRILWIIYATILFSLSQWENWLWGFQLQWFLNLLAVAAGGYIIANRKIDLMTIAMLAGCGVVATFSLSSGILYWISVFFFLVIYQIKESPKHGLYICISWLVTSGIVVCVYLYGYSKPAHHPSLLFLFENPSQFIRYIGRYLGTPLNFFGGSTLKSFLFGPLGILVFGLISGICIYRLKFTRLQPYLFFVHIGLYSILSALLTAIGRSGFGAEQAAVSRYTSVSNLLWISVVFFLFSTRAELRPNSKIFGYALKYSKIILLAAIILSLNVKSYQSHKFFKESYGYRKYGQFAVQHGTYLDGLKILFPYPEQLSKHDIPLLNRLKLSVFKDPIPPVVFEYGTDDWILKGGWTFEGIYKFDYLNLNPADHYVLGSWSGADQNTGSIRSRPYQIESPLSVTIPVIHGPDISNQKIGVKFEIEPVELLCEFNSKPHRWSLCQLDLAPYVGKDMVIFAEDKGTQWGQWFGFAQPMLIKLK